MVRFRWLYPSVITLGVVACGSDSGGGGPAAAPDIIDIVADANRDGVVDDKNGPGARERMGHDGGRVVHRQPRRRRHGRQARLRGRDHQRTSRPRSTSRVFQVSAWPTAPADAEGVVSIDPEAAESVRIFRDNPDGTQSLVLGSMGPCTSAADCTYALEYRFPQAEVVTGVTFRIEGRRFKGMPMPSLNPQDDGKKSLWTGVVDVAYSVAKVGHGRALRHQRRARRLRPPEAPRRALADVRQHGPA